MPLNRERLIAGQSQFYRDNYRRLLLFILFLLLIGFALFATVVYQHITRPPSKYFVTTSDGRLIEILPIQ